MIAHLDIDAFFAAVEIHRRPELRGRPVVVGGDPHGRGVVATASYAARRFGIRSAMSAAEALRRCPEAVFLRPDMALYREWSARVWDLVGDAAAAVEVVGLDEGYLELPDDGAAEAADAVRRAVAERIRLSCSLGVATCKVVAKVASDRDKPGGVTVVAPGEEAAFLAPLPLRALPGVGPRTEERLARAGLATIGDLAALGDDALRGLVPGRFGEDLRRRARGVDPRPVAAAPAERISVSAETTFERDVSDPAHLDTVGRDLAGRVAEALRRRAAGRADDHREAALLRLPDDHARPHRRGGGRRHGRHLGDGLGPPRAGAARAARRAAAAGRGRLGPAPRPPALPLLRPQRVGSGR